jgi:hypothetical protein
MRKPKKKFVSQSLIGLRPGDIVIVTRDDGDEEMRVVRMSPWQLGHGEWVVGLSGISGGFLLNRCKKTSIRPAGSTSSGINSIPGIGRDTSPFVKDLLSKLMEFLGTDGLRNAWIENKVMKAYVRKSKRLINDQELSDCLDLATMEIDEKHQGKGLGSDFIRLAHEANPYEFTFLENVLNERFCVHLIGLGWARVPVSIRTQGYCLCLYKLVRQ